MTEKHLKEQVNETEIAKLRLLLMVLTVIQLTCVILSYSISELFTKLMLNFHLDWILVALNYIVAGIFLWYNWKKLPITKKKKIDSTWMILLLGIIGMWFWIPNKAEIKKMNE